MKKLILFISPILLASCNLINEKIEITCIGEHTKSGFTFDVEKDKFSKSIEIVKTKHETVIDNNKREVYDWAIKTDEESFLFAENSEIKGDKLNSFSESSLNVTKDMIKYESLRSSDALDGNKKLSDSYNRVIKINRNSGTYYEHSQIYNAYTTIPFTITHEYNGKCVKSKGAF